MTFLMLMVFGLVGIGTSLAGFTILVEGGRDGAVLFVGGVLIILVCMVLDEVHRIKKR